MRRPATRVLTAVLVTALVVLGSAPAVSARGADVPTASTPVPLPPGQVIEISGPAVDPSHVVCGEFGCIGEGVAWQYDARVLEPGPAGCPTAGSNTSVCQLRRTAALIVNQAQTTTVTFQKFFGHSAMTAEESREYRLAPNAFTADYRVLWPDGTDATESVRFDRVFLVRSGASATAGQCVDSLALGRSLTLATPAPLCISVVFSFNEKGFRLGWGLPGWPAYDVIPVGTTTSTSTQLRSLDAPYGVDGPVSFTGGRVATIRVPAAPRATISRVVEPLAVGGTATWRATIANPGSKGKPWSYTLSLSVYGPGRTRIWPIEGTLAGMPVRRVGTAAGPIVYSRPLSGTTTAPSVTLSMTMEGVTPGDAVVLIGGSASIPGVVFSPQTGFSSVTEVPVRVYAAGTLPPRAAWCLGSCLPRPSLVSASLNRRAAGAALRRAAPGKVVVAVSGAPRVAYVVRVAEYGRCVAGRPSGKATVRSTLRVTLPASGRARVALAGSFVVGRGVTATVLRGTAATSSASACRAVANPRR